MELIKEKITKDRLKDIAKEDYNSMIKGTVDIEKEIIALGGEFHSDSNNLLIKDGSSQRNIWGFNIYVNKPKDDWIEFISLINIRPADDNFDMEIQSPKIREKIINIVNNLIC